MSRITNSMRVIAIKIPNNNSVSGSWTNYITSAGQIEADTGFTFFTALPPAVASALRGEMDGQTTTNPPPAIFGFSPTNGAASAAFNVDSGTQITATVPTNASSGFISVTTPGGTAVSSNNFIVTGGGNGGNTNT